MINIQKRDVFLSYVAYFLQLFSNIIILPFVLRNVSSAEYGLWTIYVSLGGFTVLLDLGFGPVIVRYITYAYCGAKDISKKGMISVKDNKEPNYKLLFLVMLSAKKIYGIITIILTFVLSLGTLYIIHISNNEISFQKIIFSWILYSSGIIISTYFQYYNTMLKGMGKVKDLQINIIINQIFGIFVKIILLSMGCGLIALAAAQFVMLVLFRFQLAVKVNKLIIQKRDYYESSKKKIKENFTNIYESIRYNSKGMGLVLLSNTVQNQGTTLLCSAFLPLSMIGSYGITNQLIGLVATLSSIPFATYMPQISSHLLYEEKEKLKDTYSICTSFFLLAFFLGSIMIMIIGSFGLEFIGAKTVMLPLVQTVILLVYNFITVNHQRCTNVISLSNKQPFVKAYVISSFISIIGAFIFMYIGAGLNGLIVSSLIVQLVYNGWKWPIESLKIIDINTIEILKRTYKIAKLRISNIVRSI